VRSARRLDGLKARKRIAQGIALGKAILGGVLGIAQPLEEVISATSKTHVTGI
jgi:hypothetical protein